MILTFSKVSYKTNKLDKSYCFAKVNYLRITPIPGKPGKVIFAPSYINPRYRSFLINKGPSKSA